MAAEVPQQGETTETLAPAVSPTPALEELDPTKEPSQLGKHPRSEDDANAEDTPESKLTSFLNAPSSFPRIGVVQLILRHYREKAEAAEAEEAAKTLLSLNPANQSTSTAPDPSKSEEEVPLKFRWRIEHTQTLHWHADSRVTPLNEIYALLGLPAADEAPGMPSKRGEAITNMKKSRMLNQPTSILGKTDLIQALDHDSAWDLLPRHAREHLYTLLPLRTVDTPPWDPDVHPMHTEMRPYIEETIRQWKEDLKCGRETKKWRDSAIIAGMERVEGKFEEFRRAERDAKFKNWTQLLGSIEKGEYDSEDEDAEHEADANEAEEEEKEVEVNADGLPIHDVD